LTFTCELEGKIQRMRRKLPERALFNSEHTDGYTQHPTVDVLFCPSAVLQPEGRELH